MTKYAINQSFRYRGTDFEAGKVYDLDEDHVPGFTQHWMTKLGKGSAVADDDDREVLPDPRLTKPSLDGDDEPPASASPGGADGDAPKGEAPSGGVPIGDTNVSYGSLLSPALTDEPPGQVGIPADQEPEVEPVPEEPVPEESPEEPLTEAELDELGAPVEGEPAEGEGEGEGGTKFKRSKSHKRTRR